jgi:hypothetical protein
MKIEGWLQKPAVQFAFLFIIYVYNSIVAVPFFIRSRVASGPSLRSFPEEMVFHIC